MQTLMTSIEDAGTLLDERRCLILCMMRTRQVDETVDMKMLDLGDAGVLSLKAVVATIAEIDIDRGVRALGG